MAAPTVRLTCGPAGSGKTAALVARVRELAASGVPTADVLACAPTHDAAEDLRRRLAAELEPAGVPVPAVRSVRELAHAAAGEPRVLARVERSILLADLRARGFAAAQVSAAFAGVLAAWARGDSAPEPADACEAALLAALAARTSTLPEALAAAGLARLRAGAPGAPARVPHVLADDAHLMTPAELALVSELAGASFGVYADEGFELPGALASATAARVELSAPAHRLRAARPYVVKWVDADEEAAGVAAFVDLSLRRLECEPGEAFVACPNRAWRRRVEQALERAGLAASAPGEERVLPADPRTPAGCRALRIYAGVRLVAAETDVAAWRAWCATGHADLSAAAWAALEDEATAAGVGVVQALAALAQDPAASRVPGAARLAAEYGAALDFVGRCGRKTGRALVEAADPSRTPAFRELVCSDSGGVSLHEGAPQLIARAQARIADARFAPRASAVRVGSLADLVGLHPCVLVLAGANEGLLAPEGVTAACGMGAEELLVSFVQRMGADEAAACGAVVRRTRREGEESVALLARPSGLDALGAEVPSTMSGQQFCASVLGLRP